MYALLLYRVLHCFYNELSVVISPISIASQPQSYFIRQDRAIRAVARGLLFNSTAALLSATTLAASSLRLAKTKKSLRTMAMSTNIRNWIETDTMWVSRASIPSKGNFKNVSGFGFSANGSPAGLYFVGCGHVNLGVRYKTNAQTFTMAAARRPSYLIATNHPEIIVR